MKVHIVAHEWQSNQVLARLVGKLISSTDWTVSDSPDPRVDINYFFPYLLLDRYPDFKATKTAAAFSHRETSRKNKADIWDRAASRVDLRLTWARQYYNLLSKTGPAAITLPFIDLGRFLPASERQSHAKPLVGLSGYVYEGGRKGETLVSRLAQGELGQEIALTASGKGWPVPTREYDWDQLPAFYQSLDVFLCTSLIEGIPMPPLEAMACGIPVVIPRGVGLLDELPNLQNIHRYTAGGYASMEAALREALAESINRESLRGAALRFTDQAWVSSHEDAFDSLLNEVPAIPANLPKWKSNAGVFIVAFGIPARECAERCMVSIRDNMPGLPICLVSDQPIGLETIFVESEDVDIGARSAKTRIYDLAPSEWEYVLYLDADTEVVADIGFLFQLLEDGWEFVICINPAQYVLAREMLRPDNAEEIEETFGMLGTDEILQLNGGVFAFRRNDRTANLIRNWHKEWDRYGARDQAALDRALYTDPVRVYVLGNEWNTITRYLDASSTAGILHYPMTARRWKGRINGRLDGSEAWASVHPSDRKGKR